LRPSISDFIEFLQFEVQVDEDSELEPFKKIEEVVGAAAAVSEEEPKQEQHALLFPNIAERANTTQANEIKQEETIETKKETIADPTRNGIENTQKEDVKMENVMNEIQTQPSTLIENNANNNNNNNNNNNAKLSESIIAQTPISKQSPSEILDKFVKSDFSSGAFVALRYRILAEFNSLISEFDKTFPSVNWLTLEGINQLDPDDINSDLLKLKKKWKNLN